MAITAVPSDTDGVVEVSGRVELVPLSRLPTHELDGGIARYTCPHCADLHALVLLVEREGADGPESGIAVSTDDEAWAVGQFLLVEAFGLISPAGWMVIRAKAAAEAERGPAPEVMN